MGKILQIEEDYLDELIKFVSSKTVGKVLKRFELGGSTDMVKREIKELLYESWRDFGDLVYAYTKGLEISVFNFKRPKKRVLTPTGE